MSAWYETCVVVAGQVRDVIVRGNRQGAVRQIEELKSRWPEAEMVFVRQHGHKSPTGNPTFRVLHKLTWKREIAA